MGRPIFNYELGDQDFSWLISNFKENNPNYTVLESSSLPVVFIGSSESPVETPSEEVPSFDIVPCEDDKKPVDAIEKP